MHYWLEFSLSLKSEITPSEEAVVTDPEWFLHIRKAFANASINPNWFMIKVSLEDALNQNLMQQVQSKSGKQPVADLKFACDHPNKYFNVRVERRFTKEELEQGAWLYLLPGERELARHGTVSPEGVYIVPKVHNKKNVHYGSNPPGPWMHLFSEDLKSKFLASGLNVNFEPVLLEKGGLSGLWQLHSNQRMPILAMTLLDSRYQPFRGDQSKGCMIDEGNYYPHVLKFRESDIRMLPDFDVAFSQERFGFQHQAHPQIVVSQHFRQVAEKLAPGQFSYGLVAVGEGEELQTRFTIPELAPPREML